ncbi:unnamed protein product [Cladocopium goreaui]|uniref:DUF676 domain-containing protein n=1 Tax=Cladocopium goreaui TaxID=2562237 RepID=A0A9P1GMY5_9DINO|nr:unnamed protein product [Cladocopium goreaui]
MDEQQSFSRHVTPTTICGEKNRSELGVESETPEMTGSIPLCIMVHGMGGSDADWQTWVEILSQRFPDWVLWPLQKLRAASSFMGRDLRELSKMAAAEIFEVVRGTQASSPGSRIVLHCIGHSMGGLIIRGALPSLLENFDDSVDLGHYLSLSSPHMGIQSSWLLPLHAWRNLCWLSRPVSLQLPQLALQDCSERPYLLEISHAESESMEILGQFQSCSCASLAFGDPLIPSASGMINPEMLLESHSIVDESFWRLEFDDTFAERSAGTRAPGIKEPTAKWMVISKTLLAVLHMMLSLLFGFMIAMASPCTILRTTLKRSSMSEVQLRKGDSSPEGPAPKLSWTFSQDLKCRYPEEIYDGLVSIPWRRILAYAHHRPVGRNMHVFLIGKRAEQHPEEHKMSRQCIERLAEILGPK